MTWDVVVEHPDGRQRRYSFPQRIDAATAQSRLIHSPWIPEPLCPCCQMQSVTVDDTPMERYAIEEVFIEESPQ